MDLVKVVCPNKRILTLRLGASASERYVVVVLPFFQNRLDDERLQSRRIPTSLEKTKTKKKTTTSKKKKSGTTSSSSSSFRGGVGKAEERALRDRRRSRQHHVILCYVSLFFAQRRSKVGGFPRVFRGKNEFFQTIKNRFIY